MAAHVEPSAMRAAYLRQLAEGRARLEASFAGVDDERMSEPGDESWAPKDHLAHVTAWEGAHTAVLRGGTTPGSLGFDAEEYVALPDDEINDELFARTEALAPAAVVAALRAQRVELMAAIEALSDADLETLFTRVRKQEAPNNPDWTVWDWLVAYAPEHDIEHAAYIDQLLSAAQG